MRFTNCHRVISINIFPIVGTVHAFAYDSEDLVGSAFEFRDVDSHTFMMYFQDGNILSFILGVLCGVFLLVLRKHINQKLKTALIAFEATLIVSPIFLMIYGVGSEALGYIFLFTALGVLGLLFMMILPGMLILWMYKFFNTKNIKLSTMIVRSPFINGVGTALVSIVVGTFVCFVISLISCSWNLSQCEEYVKSQWNENFDRVPKLMYEWEQAHKFQWGNNAKKYYERREQPCDSVEEIIEMGN